jgi:hypothetical protein
VERVTFVIERTAARISCLLNPEALETRRTAGIARRRGAGGAVLGNPRTDDPLIATGGGITEYDLQLLFDVEIANEQRPTQPAAPPLPAPPSVAEALQDATDQAAATTDTGDAAPPPLMIAAPPPVMDVRSLTQPLWALAETGEPVDGAVAPQRVRFIWGKSWNVPGVVIAVAERLERFDADGVPQRSWLSLRLRRVEEQTDTGAPPRQPTTPQFEIDSSSPGDADGNADTDLDSVTLPVDTEGFALDRLDQVAAEYYGDPSLARAIADYNALDDMLRFGEGDRLRLPPRDALAA